MSEKPEGIICTPEDHFARPLAIEIESILQANMMTAVKLFSDEAGKQSTTRKVGITNWNSYYFSDREPSFLTPVLFLAFEVVNTFGRDSHKSFTARRTGSGEFSEVYGSRQCIERHASLGSKLPASVRIGIWKGNDCTDQKLRPELDVMEAEWDVCTGRSRIYPTPCLLARML